MIGGLGHGRRRIAARRAGRADEGFGVKGSRRRAAGGVAQGTVEYALTLVALLAIVIALAALWRAGQDGALAELVRQAASHALAGTGPLDISLF